MEQQQQQPVATPVVNTSGRHQPRPAEFRPALLVIDMQEDFCPPNGTLAVVGGRDIIPTINALLANRTFLIRVASKDWHPTNHVSFASNHLPPNNVPFKSEATITNPYNLSEKPYRTRLWPIHCVQGTHGAELVPELARTLIDETIEKGQDPRIEMYSCFHDPFETPRVVDTGLEEKLNELRITHVYIVGLAFDFCVKYSALDARRAGFEVFVVSEGTRAVVAENWLATEKELHSNGVKVIRAGDSALRWLHAQVENIYL
ncbi:NAD(+) salvage pathway protein [Orbilia brochopaga]|uniref:nicotinamidase n=1 Tax=Orbilia brochopaga TaxID=3140254 RepID=A0AAV9V2P8_9PEZI